MPPKADPYATKLHRRIDALLFLLTVLIIAIVLRTSARGQGILPQVISVAPQPFWSTFSLFHVEPKLSLAMREPALAIDSQLDYTGANGADFSALAGLSENSSTEFSPILMVQEKTSAPVAPAMLEPDNAHRSFVSSSPGLADNWSQTAGIGTTIPAVIMGFGRTTGSASEVASNSQQSQTMAAAIDNWSRYVGEKAAHVAPSVPASTFEQSFSTDSGTSRHSASHEASQFLAAQTAAITTADTRHQFTLTSTPDAILATRYWDTTAGAGNGVGGSGNWTAQANNLWSTTSTGDAVLTSAATTDAGIFEGTAGTLTISFSPTLASWTFNTTGYTLANNDGTNRVYSGSFSLASNVNLNLGLAGTTADRTTTLSGSLSGGAGSTLTIRGAQTSNNANRINLGQNSMSISADTIINMSGAGVGGYVATATGTTISGGITNNGTGATMLGATLSNDLTLTGKISGSGDVRFQADKGTAAVGAGTVTIGGTSGQNDYTGASVINLGNNGSVKLGVDNALSTASAVQFGTTGSTSNIGFIDMNGKNQRIASLASNTSGSMQGIRNATANSLSTLTIQGSATTVYAGPIGTANFNNIGLTLSALNSGILTLSGTTTYTGGTNINGGTLALGNASDTLANTASVSVGGGTLSIGANSDTVGAVSLASGNITGSTGTLTGSSYAVQSGSITARLGGSASLTKTTTGTVTLSGANTFIGSTTIAANGGTLVAAAGSLVSTSSVTVNSGGTLLLSGNGRHLGNATGVILQGGTFNTGGLSEPGGVPGSQNIGALTLTSTSTIDFGVGNLSVLEFAGVGTHIASTMLQIINWDGIPVLGGSGDRLLFNGLATTFTGAYNQNDVSFNGMSGYLAVQFDPFGPNPYFEITSLTPVPEPSTWAAAALALGAIAWTQLRKRGSRSRTHSEFAQAHSEA